jgi:hypothetical protein
MLASCDQLSTHATTNHMKQCQYFKIETTFYHSPSQTLNIFLKKYVFGQKITAWDYLTQHPRVHHPLDAHYN